MWIRQRLFASPCLVGTQAMKLVTSVLPIALCYCKLLLVAAASGCFETLLLKVYKQSSEYARKLVILEWPNASSDCLLTWMHVLISYHLNSNDILGLNHAVTSWSKLFFKWFSFDVVHHPKTTWCLLVLKRLDLILCYTILYLFC